MPSSVQLRDNLENIVSEINAKRKRDSDLLDGKSFNMIQLFYAPVDLLLVFVVSRAKEAI